MVAKFVAQRAQKRPERSHLFPDRRAHPHANQQRLRMVVAEEFRRRILPHPQRPRREHPHRARRHAIELRRRAQKVRAGPGRLAGGSRFHRCFERRRYLHEPTVGRQLHLRRAVADEKRLSMFSFWRCIRKHRLLFCDTFRSRAGPRFSCDGRLTNKRGLRIARKGQRLRAERWTAVLVSRAPVARAESSQSVRSACAGSLFAASRAPGCALAGAPLPDKSGRTAAIPSALVPEE